MARGTVVQKIIDNHYVSGEKTPGAPVAIRIDQTLTQDATGTMAYLELEAMNVTRVSTELMLTIICCKTGRKIAMTTCICNLLLRRRESSFLLQEMAFVIRFIWNVSVFPGKHYWVQTAIHRQTVVSG